MHNVFGVLHKYNVLIIVIDTDVSIYTVAKPSVEFRVSHVMTNQERNKLCSNLAFSKE